VLQRHFHLVLIPSCGPNYVNLELSKISALAKEEIKNLENIILKLSSPL
jgi:hypothetical protein